MEKLSLFGILAISIMTIAGCNCEDPEPTPQGDYFIFGHFYGECMGEECRETFKIQGGKLYEDQLDIYPTGANSNTFSFELLSDAVYQEVADLPGFLPSALLDITNGVIGMPDAGDWGGFYVETTQNGVTRFWMIDTMKGNIPTELHDFTDKVRDAISEINN